MIPQYISRVLLKFLPEDSLPCSKRPTPTMGYLVGLDWDENSVTLIKINRAHLKNQLVRLANPQYVSI